MSTPLNDELPPHELPTEDVAFNELTEGLGLDKHIIFLAGYAPAAAFMMVSGADGHIHKAEVATFLAALKSVSDPTLRLLSESHDEPMQERFDQLAEKPDLIRASITAVGEVFRAMDHGAAHRDAFLAFVERVAQADHVLKDSEKRALERVKKLLDTPFGSASESTMAPYAVAGGLALLVLAGLAGAAWMALL